MSDNPPTAGFNIPLTKLNEFSCFYTTKGDNDTNTLLRLQTLHHPHPPHTVFSNINWKPRHIKTKGLFTNQPPSLSSYYPFSLFFINGVYNATTLLTHLALFVIFAHLLWGRGWG